MISTSLKPLVEELKQQDFNKDDRRFFIELLSKNTQNKVADILEIQWRDAKNIQYYWEERIEISSCDISDCLEVSQAAVEYADYIESKLKCIEFSKILHEQEHSTLNLRTNERIPKIGKIHFSEEPYTVDLRFEDENQGKILWTIEMALPIKNSNQKLIFEVWLKKEYNVHQANMDILALKNVMENTNGAELIQSKLENIMRKYTDSMTWLYNGLFVEETLTNPDHNYSFIFIDISRFKEINDSNWQKTWDDAIKKVAQILEKYSRMEDKVCRLGWDEFAILFNNADQAVMQNFISRLEKQDIFVENQEHKKVNIDLKFGYAINDGKNNNHKELLSVANEMLNQNKDKKWAAYRFKSMLLDYDEETRVYALWELICDSECLDYVLDAILTEPATDLFLDKFGSLIDVFLSWDLYKINQRSRDSLQKFTDKFNIRTQAA